MYSTSSGFTRSRASTMIEWSTENWHTGSTAAASPESCERLAATAAEVGVLPVERAALARLGHPVGATEAVERLRVEPDLLERLVADVVELHPGDDRRRLTWENIAVRARSGSRRAPSRPCTASAAPRSSPGSTQRISIFGPIRSRAAITTASPCSSCARVGISASRFGSAQPWYCVFASSTRRASSDSASAMISSIRSRLRRCRTTLIVSGKPSSRARCAASIFFEKRLRAGDDVRRDRVAVLDADLHVIEPRLLQRNRALARERRAGRDERAVEARLGGDASQLLGVLAHERLAAGQRELQHAEIGGLAGRRATSPPSRARRGTSQRRSRAGSSSRDSAAGTCRRALRSGGAGCQLFGIDDQPSRCDCFEKVLDIGANVGAVVARAQLVRDVVEVRSPSQSSSTSTAVGFKPSAPSGIEQHMPVAHAVPVQPDPVQASFGA